MTLLRLNTLAMSYDSAARVAERKSVWMALWLRARRDSDCLRAYYRRQHFRARAAQVKSS